MATVEVSLLVLASLFVLKNYGFVARVCRRIIQNKIAAHILRNDNECYAYIVTMKL